MNLPKGNSRKWQNQAKSGQAPALDPLGLIEVAMCEPQISVSYSCLKAATLKYGGSSATNARARFFWV
jgi:hypothetical protein